MLHISAQITHRQADGTGPEQQLTVTTNDRTQTLAIPSKAQGSGSSVNGGELLLAALASCYCNDVYREAAFRGITVHRVEVEVQAAFEPTPGSVARHLTYRARVTAEADEQTILALMQHTDTVAEIQNTLRQGMDIILESMEAIPVEPSG